MPSVPRTSRTRLRAALPWIAAALFAVAVVSIGRLVRKLGWDAIADALWATAPLDVAAAAAATAASYVALSLFDTLAIRYVVEQRVPYRRIALASFTAVSVGHTVGLAGLSSGAVRYRIYSHYGLGEGDVARIVLFSGATVAVGLASLAALGCLLDAGAVAAFSGLPTWGVASLGVVSAALALGYVALAAREPGPVRVRGFRLPLPPFRGAVLQVGIGSLNFFLVSLALRSLLGDAVQVPLATFAAYYAAANALSILSHVPGGLGVVEAVVLAAAPSADTAGALIAFRLIYYAVPFVLGGLTYAAFELRRRRGGRARSEDLARGA